MNPYHTPAQLARFVGTIEGFTAGVSLEPSTALAIQSIRDGFSFKRAKRDASPVTRFPEVDRRVSERRASERRAMQDVLDRRAKRREGEPLSLWGNNL